MTGRKYSAGNVYHYGFNGKENDNDVKGEGNQQDYGMRIYDPRLGRFLSVDPIAKSYPHLTPYQFASNRPIDGIDQDGLEYIHYNVFLSKSGTFLGKVIVEDFRYKSEEEMNRIHNTKSFYTEFSAGFGREGRGVKYTYFIQNDDAEWKPLESLMEFSQNNGIDDITRHGLHYGAGSITSKGPYFGTQSAAGTGYYDFSFKPIDMVDASGKEHDREEDVKGFAGWQHPQNIYADIRFVKRLEKYLELTMDVSYKDPYTGKKPSQEAIGAANNALTLFKTEIVRKKMDMMQKLENKKINERFYSWFELRVTKTEKQQVSLPQPSQKDK